MTTAEGGWIGLILPDVGWVEVALATVQGQPEIVGLRIDARNLFVREEDKYVLDLPQEQQRQWAIDNAHQEDAPRAVITAERLRRLPLAEMRAAAAAHLAGDDAFAAFEKVSRQRGKAWSDDHYRQVAEVYKAAVDRRQSPLKAIESHWNVSRAGASKYVKRARELGFLGWPERRGVPGYESDHGLSEPLRLRCFRPPKLLVANTLRQRSSILPSWTSRAACVISTSALATRCAATWTSAIRSSLASTAENVLGTPTASTPLSIPNKCCSGTTTGAGWTLASPLSAAP